ncbi:tRNA (adenosine(37)-N6)-dimethylallyltransferase MiaA [Eubacterium coprostanoligenes]|uniref:tRNA (adenosine(37)-N6)-dimethylallyltransferase MiaA n=1 Tax=Eubacterium coprostanoligenes TaxID=290054 RepID=UPI00235732BD|nr:tRNA (adenosine(37)-N6)-dimethylallyltransferase MiaA [Eubacterium coprostanoligenes]MCI6254377.1 tRNA (adenosine(37)-N6)-dimethylallyltransferase MiaA [Eubacterium coprostanoligenes]MDY5400544.1 tRNA (adenosine(37)-N6)-dimethylallyltransferase MiaA [Eubacterium coprostanoligenes]
MEKTKIICVVGATASGKTDLAVKLAKAVDGEIISADSMQVYKNMPIATAVATKEEQDGVPHHLVEFLDTDQTFSVADFVERAKVLIDEITARGRVPIVAGGTGLFVDSLVKNISFSEFGSNAEIRNELAEKSNEELFEKLVELDPKSAEDIHPNNRKRVIRALELCMSGTSKTEQNENSMLIDSPYDALYIGIGYQDRQKLYDRINKRVDLMLEAGLENEARQMLGKQGLTARQAIGHKELQPYIDGNITLDEAVEGLKRETRRYAKRQLTWFRRNENINWLYADEMSRDELVEKAVDLAKNHLK